MSGMPSRIVVPQGFLDWRRYLSGSAAEAWLDQLPCLVDELCADWQLEPDGGELFYGGMNLIVPVLAIGQQAMLKVGWIEHDIALEARALRAWDGLGAARLLEIDPGRNALLIERLDSGRSLRRLPVLESAAQAGRLIRVLTIEPPAGIPLLADLTEQFAQTARASNGDLGRPVPLRWVDRTEALARELVSGCDRVLVHADLHDENILARPDTGEWAAIDPRPVVGDPEYSLPELMWTRCDELTDSGLRELFQVITQAGDLDQERAAAWLQVRLVDYWLWGLGAGLTEDPVRCHRLLSVFANA